MRLLRWLWVGITLLFGGLAYMSQVGPDDALSNLSQWYTKATKLSAPTWLQDPQLDFLWTVFFSVLAIASFFWFVWPHRHTVVKFPIRRADTATPEVLNISEWVNHENYFVWVAACLWVEIKPIERIGSGSPAYPALQKIKGAISSGQIDSLSGSAAASDRVSREGLLKLSYIHNEKPKFLFPEKNVTGSGLET